MSEAAIREVAVLARLQLDSAQIPALAEHFQRVLDFVALLARVDVSDATADLHPPLSTSDLRPDDPGEATNAQDGEGFRRAVLQNAPASDDSCFVVPRVIG